MPLESLKDKCVVITGAAQAVGGAIALAMANEGAKIALVDRTDSAAEKDALNAAVADVKAVGAEVLSIAVDVRREEGVAECHRIVEQAWGTVDVLVNCAKTAWEGNSWEMSADE